MEAWTMSEQGYSLNATSYEFDFFSGAQMSIYIGDIYVDDINTLRFTVTQSKAPIYGYASQYYHTLADGRIFVRGDFALSFKESGYLINVLQNYRQEAPITAKGKQHLVLRENIERYLQKKHERRRTDASKYQFYRDLSALPDETFENIAETFEDKLWKSGFASEEQFMTPNIPQSRYAYSDDDVLIYRRADQYPPFDIWVLYGDISNKAANHTIHKIVGASIVDVTQQISVDGEPIQEAYSFVARNLV